MKEILHLGCGGEKLPPNMSHCKEVRLDIDAKHNPDIIADMADLPSDIGPFDGAYSSHSLEHLFPHDVDACLQGILRVLKPGGVAIIRVPDLEDLSPTDDILYEVVGGPIKCRDLFYGWDRLLATCPHMAHKTGFVKKTLHAALERAGFEDISIARVPKAYELFAVGVRP